jgi:hypothetical protein
MCPAVIPLRQPQGLEAALRYHSPSTATNGGDAALLFPFILAKKGVYR